jgi:DNA invertase Pin-like site-specific DNA recombinase
MLPMNAAAKPQAAKLIGYIRVSTAKQGQSGLGLESQTAAIAAYAAQCGGTVGTVYKDVESGRNNDRPELAKAIAHARRVKGKLVIAKLDRLARNIHFISGLMESKVDFVACDNPCANKLTVHILACIAEHEAEAISARTRAALEAAKQRGTLLGSARPDHWRGRESVRLAAAAKARQAAAAAHAAEAEPLYAEVRPIIRTMKAEGASLQIIADRLNADGFTTLRGSAWNRMQVSRLG